MTTTSSSADAVTTEPWHHHPVDDVFGLLDTSSHGLTEDEAQARLAHHGPNQLEEEPPPSALVVFLRQFRSR